MKFSEFFKNHPEKILGTQIDTTNQYGQAIKVVKGDLSELAKIDVSPSLEPQIRETAEFVDLDAMKNIQASLAKTVLERETKTEKLVDKSNSNVYLQPIVGQEMFTEPEAFDFLNEGIDENDVRVWVYYCIDNNRPVHKYLIDRFKTTYSNDWFKRQMENGFLCFDYETGKYVPRVIYYAGNIAEKIAKLKQINGSNEPILGEKQKEFQLQKLAEIEPEKLRLSGDVSMRLVLDPLSKFCKEFKLSSGETIFKEFKIYVESVPDEERLTDLRNWYITSYFLDQERMSNRFSKEEKQEMKIKAAKEIPYLMTKFCDELPEQDKSKIEYLWNLENNAFVDPNYNQVPLMFVISKTFKNKPLSIRPEQREGVAFNEINGTGVLGFDVGVGKTLTAILTIAQFMQSGRCKRPIIVVPKPTFHKWIGEIRGIFSESNELQGTGIIPNIAINAFYNFGKDVLKNQTIDVSDQSLSVVTYQGAKKLGFSDDYSFEFKNRLNEIMEQTGDMTQRAREAFKQKSETLLSEGQFNAEVLMDELLFDFLCMDEAHNANKIFMSVKGEVQEDGNRQKSRFAFGGGSPSMLGRKMFFLSQFVQANSNGLGNVQLLTATPFTNNPLNVYNIFALTNFERLKSYGIENVNTFFEKYVEVTMDKVVNSRGQLEEKEVIKSWKNKVALQKILFGIINYKGAKDSPSVKRPNKIVLPLLSETINGQVIPLPSDKQIITILAPTERQRANKTEISNWLQAALSDIELKKQAPYLVADGMASKNTLSPLIYENIPPANISPKDFIETSPKLDTMVRTIKGINDWFDERKAPRSCQIIYAAQGIEYFPLIKQYLMDNLGYKSKVVQYEKNKYFDEVEILAGSAVDDDLKEEIKSAFNAGKIKVLIGSSTIREGIDLQTRTSTLHDLWPSWNSTDKKQLEGRLWRFGNMFDYVRIISYLVQGGSDMFKYQKLQEKTARINDIFDRLNKDNILDVSEEDLEAVKWALVDDINEIVKDQIKESVTEQKRRIKIIDNYIESYETLENDMVSLDNYQKQMLQYAEIVKRNNAVFQFDLVGKTPDQITKIASLNYSKIINSNIPYGDRSELTGWQIGQTIRQEKLLSAKLKRLDDFTKTTRGKSIFEIDTKNEIELLQSEKQDLLADIEKLESQENKDRLYAEIEQKRNAEIALSATPEIVSKRILSLNDTCLKVISVEDELTKPDPSVEAPKQKVTKEEMKKQFAKAGAKAAEKNVENGIIPEVFEDLDEEVEYDWDFTFEDGSKLSEKEIKTIDVFNDNIYDVEFYDGKTISLKTKELIGLLSITNNDVKISVIFENEEFLGSKEKNQDLKNRIYKLANKTKRILVSTNDDKLYPFVMKKILFDKETKRKKSKFLNYKFELIKGYHLTQTRRTAIATILDARMLEGKFGRSNYFLTSKGNNIYDVKIVVNEERNIGEGVKKQIDTFVLKITPINQKESKPAPISKPYSSSIDDAIESLRLSLEFLPSPEQEQTKIALEALEISKEFL